jgi:DNA-binding response OmpR family regulator
MRRNGVTRLSLAAPLRLGLVMGERILIVEDNALLAIELAEALKAAGFETVGPALTVAQAIALIGKTGCDAAVLDINLRGETSETVAQKLRDGGVPFVTMTGYARTQQPAIFDGVPTFTKPVAMELVIAELRRSAAQRR